MKEKIYTIPVMDAVRENSECPFCVMLASLEKNAVEFVMGPSYMERDVRAETDRLGFCGRHLKVMAAAQNSLGLALMLQTRLMRVNKELKSASKGVSGAAMSAKKGLFGGVTGGKTQSPLSELISKQTESCYVCEKAQVTFKLYIDTFFYLWESEEELRKLVKDGNGFCISHFAMLLDEGAKKLSKKSYGDFNSIITEVQFKNMDRLEEEIDWFVKKFDYRYVNEPWKNSKDSPQRSVTKLSSVLMDEK